jgi:ribosomal protein L35AE/L33A
MEEAMHAVIVRVNITDPESATQYLRETIVPRVSQAPGFVAGYWVRLEGTEGNSVVVFESEDAARTAADQIRATVGDNPGASLDNVMVGEVVANA